PSAHAELRLGDSRDERRRTRLDPLGDLHGALRPSVHRQPERQQRRHEHDGAAERHQRSDRRAERRSVVQSRRVPGGPVRHIRQRGPQPTHRSGVLEHGPHNPAADSPDAACRDDAALGYLQRVQLRQLRPAEPRSHEHGDGRHHHQPCQRSADDADRGATDVLIMIKATTESTERTEHKKVCFPWIPCVLWLLLFGVAARAQYEPGARVLLDAHNCYPYDGRWADRIDRALSTGTPLAIEQDLVWFNGRSLVAHEHPRGDEPTMKQYFFEKIRPIVEKALRENKRGDWPLITLNLDFKS